MSDELWFAAALRQAKAYRTSDSHHYTSADSVRVLLTEL